MKILNKIWDAIMMLIAPCMFEPDHTAEDIRYDDSEKFYHE